MAHFVIPSRRTRQPQGAVCVNYGSPLSHDLSFLFDGVTKRNAVTRTALTPVNAPTTVAKLDGLRQNFVAASSQYIDCGTGADVTFAGGDLTVAVRYSLSTLMADDSAYQLFSRDSNSGGRSFTVDVYRRDANPGFSGARIYANGGGGSAGYNIINEGRTPVSGDDRFAVLVWAPTKNESSAWINGALIASAAASIALSTATTSARIGARTYSGLENYLNGTIGFVAAWRRGLSASEIVALSANPWQLFAPDLRKIYFGASGGGATTTTIEPSKGSLAVAGYAPGIAQPRAIAPSKGAATLTGYAPGIEQDKAVAPENGALTLTGYVPTLTQPRTIAAVKGTLTLAGYAPGISQSASGTIAPSAGALLLTGYAPGLEQDRNVAPSVGHMTLTGGQPGIVQNVTTFIAPSKGALTATGYAPSVSGTANQAIAPTAGTLLLGGYAPVLEQTGAQIIGPIKGALTLAGYAPTVQVIGTGVTLVEPTVGALILSGYAPLVRVAVTPPRGGGYSFGTMGGAERRPPQDNARRPS